MFRYQRFVGVLIVLAPFLVIAGTSRARSSDTLVVPAWRKPDRFGRACVSCHSPDGLEIAAYAFSDENIIRRAEAHVSSDDAKQIVSMVHGIRERYKIQSLLDPMKDRPMQPGGELLQGETADERDAAFALRLPSLVPLLFTKRIDSLASSQAARNQLLALELDHVQIGIPMNRVSEDGFHGKEHASIADWISDVPLDHELPVEIQDTYLESPTAQNYAAIDHALSKMFDQQSTAAQVLSLNKRRALFYYQHKLRTKLLGRMDDARPEEPNPLWGIGEFGRNFGYSQITTMGFPPDILAKKLTGPGSSDQIRNLRLPWYWLGWILNPGLQKTLPMLEETGRADYLTRLLWSDGPYPMHSAFLLTTKMVYEATLPSEWNSSQKQHLDINYSALINDNGVAGPEPKNPVHRKFFDTFLANSFRMALFLQIDELSKTHVVYIRQGLNQQIRRIKKILKDPRDQSLADKALELIRRSKDAKR